MITIRKTLAFVFTTFFFITGYEIVTFFIVIKVKFQISAQFQKSVKDFFKCVKGMLLSLYIYLTGNATVSQNLESKMLSLDSL